MTVREQAEEWVSQGGRGVAKVSLQVIYFFSQSQAGKEQVAEAVLTPWHSTDSG
jgi:hypothetical protein